MKLAMVTFAFCGGIYQKRKYFFQTDLTENDLTKGDFVVVEGPKKDSTTIARFIRFIEVDDDFQYGQKKLLKKAHGNTLKSLVQKRRKMFAELYIKPKVYDKLREVFPHYAEWTDEAIAKMLVDRLAVAAKQYNAYWKHTRYFYDDMYIAVRGKTIVDVWLNPINDKITWRPPTQLEKYL